MSSKLKRKSPSTPTFTQTQPSLEVKFEAFLAQSVYPLVNLVHSLSPLEKMVEFKENKVNLECIDSITLKSRLMFPESFANEVTLFIHKDHSPAENENEEISMSVDILDGMKAVLPHIPYCPFQKCYINKEFLSDIAEVWDYDYGGGDESIVFGNLLDHVNGGRDIMDTLQSGYLFSNEFKFEDSLWKYVASALLQILTLIKETCIKPRIGFQSDVTLRLHRSSKDPLNKFLPIGSELSVPLETKSTCIGVDKKMSTELKCTVVSRSLEETLVGGVVKHFLVVQLRFYNIFDFPECRLPC